MNFHSTARSNQSSGQLQKQIVVVCILQAKVHFKAEPSALHANAFMNDAYGIVENCILIHLINNTLDYAGTNFNNIFTMHALGI